MRPKCIYFKNIKDFIEVDFFINKPQNHTIPSTLLYFCGEIIFQNNLNSMHKIMQKNIKKLRLTSHSNN